MSFTHMFKKLLFTFTAILVLFSSVLHAKEPTQHERNEMAAKLIPIITMLLMDDATPIDTTKPSKPKVSIPAPTETREVNVDIGVSGEVGSFIYVNDIKVGTIGADGTATITLDLHDGDNLFFLRLIDASGNKSDVVDFTVNGAAVIHADRKIFIFPGDSERVVLDVNGTLSFEGDTLSWVTIDDNAIVVAPSSSEEPMQRKTVKVAISRDGNATRETVSFDILIMKKVILLEGDLGVEGGTLYNKWKDISIHFDENILEQKHHFEVYAGLNSQGALVVSSNVVPELTENEKVYHRLIMPNVSILYENYFKDNSIPLDSQKINKKLNIQSTLNRKNKTVNWSRQLKASGSNKVYYYHKMVNFIKEYCVDNEPIRLNGFEFNYIWQGYVDFFDTEKVIGGGITRLKTIGNTPKAKVFCSARLWGSKDPTHAKLSKNEEPVLLLHGFIKSGELGAMDGKEVYFKNFSKVLKSTNKYVPFEFEWRTNARFERVAKELKSAIKLIGDKTGKQVHIVAHSFGGVLGRVLIQDSVNKEFVEKYIASLTTVGSPHSGIRDGGYTSSGTFTYAENGSETIGDGTSIAFPHGQHGSQTGELMGACGAITCYQMGISDSTFNNDDSYINYGTYKEYGYIPYKLASSINLYPDVSTQVLLGLYPYYARHHDPLTYVMSPNKIGDNLISLKGQRAYPLISNKYDENNIEEHVLNLYLSDYSNFKTHGIGVYDEPILNAIYHGWGVSVDKGEYKFSISTPNSLTKDITLTSATSDSLSGRNIRGIKHRTSEFAKVNIALPPYATHYADVLSEVGLHNCETYIGCKHPTWQYFRQFAEKNIAKPIVDPKSISVTGDVKVVRSKQVASGLSKANKVREKTSVAPRVIVEVYKADKDILDFILNLVDTGERTVLRDDGTYELNVTYSPDTNYTVIAYVEGDEDARVDEHIRAAQSIFLETLETLEDSTLHFPTITLVDANYEEGNLLIKVKDSASGNFLSDFNVSVVMNGTEVNGADINVSTDMDFNVTKAKGDYTVNVYMDGYHDAKAQCTVIANKTTECIVNTSTSVDKSIVGRWIYNGGTNLREDGGTIRIIEDVASYTQVQIFPNSGCSIDYNRALSGPQYGAYTDEYGYLFSVNNKKLKVMYTAPGGEIVHEYSQQLTLSDEEIRELCPEFTSAITHNGTTYGTVTSPYTGKVWLDRNLGASRVCTAFNDSKCYGDYYQWGRGTDGHEKSTSSVDYLVDGVPDYTFNDNYISSFIAHSDTVFDWIKDGLDDSGSRRMEYWSKTDGSSVCPVGFRVPTFIELKIETLDNGVSNSNTAFLNFLALPSAGDRYRADGTMRYMGSWGHFWTSSVYPGDDWHGVGPYGIYFKDDGAYTYKGGNESFGHSVRCLRD